MQQGIVLLQGIPNFFWNLGCDELRSYNVPSTFIMKYNSSYNNGMAVCLVLYRAQMGVYPHQNIATWVGLMQQGDTQYGIVFIVFHTYGYMVRSLSYIYIYIYIQRLKVAV